MQVISISIIFEILMLPIYQKRQTPLSQQRVRKAQYNRSQDSKTLGQRQQLLEPLDWELLGDSNQESFLSGPSASALGLMHSASGIRSE